jgi:hypothetical protein
LQLKVIYIIISFERHDMSILHSTPAPHLVPGEVLARAALKAAACLGLSAKSLAAVLGLSEATLSRMKRRDLALEAGTKPFELAVLFIRMFRSLDSVTGGDEALAHAWLVNFNIALEARPIDKIVTIAGLMDVIAYLDSRRARI